MIDSKERSGAETKDALEGDTIRLACRYNPSVRRSSKELVFYWQKTTTTKGQDLAAINSNTLVEDYVLESSPLEGKYDLIISSANYDRDDGFFECKIKETGSGIEIQSTSYSVTILSKLNKMIQTFISLSDFLSFLSLLDFPSFLSYISFPFFLNNKNSITFFRLIHTQTLFSFPVFFPSYFD